MQGLVLAGGHGTRLHPTTKVINKHLLMIYDKPMIFYPIMTLRDAGIKDIVITLGDHDCDRFYELLGSGKELGVNLTYHYHGEPKGIAHAIYSAREELGDEKFVVHLGDNIFTTGLSEIIDNWSWQYADESIVVLKEMQNNASYGVADVEKTLSGTYRLRGIREKSLTPPSNFAVLGAYLLQPTFFTKFEEQLPSGRGEYEITDSLNMLSPEIVVYEDQWFDCGTVDDIFKASEWRRRCVLG